MELVLDLLQAAGIGAAVGIRPFLPALLVGALASGDLGVDFDGTDFAFLEQAPFLIAMVAGGRAVRRRPPPRSATTAWRPGAEFTVLGRDRARRRRARGRRHA